MSILVSIPVHEKIEVIENQIKNINYFLDNPYICLHISSKYNLEKDASEKRIDLKQYDKLLINENRYDTSWGNIIHTHLSNFNYARERVNFDSIVINSSNDMYVRQGASKYINLSKNGFQLKPTNNEMLWSCGKEAYLDKQLLEILKKLGTNRIWGSQPEGVFFQKDVFNEIYKLIINTNFLNDTTLFYPREEIYFSTLGEALIGESKGKPIILSEIVINGINAESDSYIKKLLKRVFQNKKITRSMIDSIRNEKPSKKWEYDGEQKLYDVNDLYGVKRIDRDINDLLRKYIGGFSES